MPGQSYKSAGVDLEAYRDAMGRLPRMLRSTYSPRVIPNDGGFAGLFQLDFASPLFARNYRDPVLVSCTDGVGTKLKVANLTGRHDTVGIDLVAMSVNDAICCGAEPLFFLDYIAMGVDDPPLLEQIVSGIAAGCVQADCALIGGETAIMPDLYAAGDYDLAGFCVGVAERERMIGRTASPGDVVLGVASSGLHSNGYSLARKIALEVAGHGIDDYIEELGCTVGEELLKPTLIYARAVRQVLRRYRVKQVVHAMAHITGGGLQENLERVLPSGVDVTIDPGAWTPSPVFAWLERLGEVERDEMRRVFNMGLGLVLVVSPYYAASIRRQFEDEGHTVAAIGEVTEGTGKVHLAG